MKTKFNIIIKFSTFFVISLLAFSNLSALDEILIRLKDKTSLSINPDSLSLIQFEKITGIKNYSGNEITEVQSFPNPFNEIIYIEIDLSKFNGNGNSSIVKPVLSVYNLNNQLIRQMDNCEISSSFLTFMWDGRDSENNSLPNGVYYYKIDFNTSQVLGKVILNK